VTTVVGTLAPVEPVQAPLSRPQERQYKVITDPPLI